MWCSRGLRSEAPPGPSEPAATTVREAYTALLLQEGSAVPRPLSRRGVLMQHWPSASAAISTDLCQSWQGAAAFQRLKQLIPMERRLVCVIESVCSF